MVRSLPVSGPGVGFGGNGTASAAPDDEADDLPATPREIQVDAADVQAFDETYLARQQNFQIEGDFSPAPFPLQVIPRVAFTINYQMVYNENRERWEPQKKSSQQALAGGGAAVSSTTQSIPANVTDTTIDVDTELFAGQATVDLASNEIVVDEAGFYQLSAILSLNDMEDQETFQCRVNVNGSKVAVGETNMSGDAGTGNRVTAQAHTVTELAAGDSVTYAANLSAASSKDVSESTAFNRLTAVRVAV